LTNQGARAKARIAGDASKWTSMLGIPVEWNAVATSPQLTWIVCLLPFPKSHDPAAAWSRETRGQFVEERFCLLQVWRVAALGEPGIDGREEVVGLLPLAPIAPEPCEAHRRAKLPRAGLLRPGDFERALEMPLRPRLVSFRRQQLDFAGDAMDLCCEPSLPGDGGRFRAHP
jgi:hypothetical protein